MASALVMSEAQGIAREALLDVRGLRTHFQTRGGTVHAVNGVSFTIGDGELIGLVGETGCGKSVTARSIIGLIRPPGIIVDGEIGFRGVDLRRLDKRNLRRIRGSGIAFVPQNPFGSLNAILRIEQQFRNVIRAHVGRTSSGRCYEMALEMLRGVGIAGPDRVLRGYAHELSGGMAQRVVIALALILNPPLVIADEPTTGLDITTQRRLLDLILELVTRDRRAMLFVTHDLGIVAQYCHRVMVMYAGKIVENGPVDEVMSNPAHPYTEALLGAIPRAGRSLISLKGTVADLIDYPKGCPFRARCGYQHELAAEVEPALREISTGRFLACHLPNGVTEPVSGAS